MLRQKCQDIRNANLQQPAAEMQWRADRDGLLNFGEYTYAEEEQKKLGWVDEFGEMDVDLDNCTEIVANLLEYIVHPLVYPS